MQQYIKPPIPQRLNLLSLANRWGIDVSVAAYQFCEFINSDFLRVATFYKGYMKRGSYRHDNYESPKAWGAVWDNYYGWHYQGQIDKLNELDELNAKSFRNSLTNSEHKRFQDLIEAKKGIYESQVFHFPVALSESLYIEEAISKGDSIMFNKAFWPCGNSENGYQFSALLEDKGEGESAVYRNHYLEKGLGELYVLRHDLMEFEQRLGICDHGLSLEAKPNNSNYKTIQSKREAVFKDWLEEIGDYEAVQSMTKDQVWRLLQEVNPKIFNANQLDFFKSQKLIAFNAGKRKQS